MVITVSRDADELILLLDSASHLSECSAKMKLDEFVGHDFEEGEAASKNSGSKNDSLWDHIIRMMRFERWKKDMLNFLDHLSSSMRLGRRPSIRSPEAV